MQCMCSVYAVWAAGRLHCFCIAYCMYTAISLECNCSVQSHHSVSAVHTVVSSVSEVYLQPPLQIHSMYWSVSAVYTAGHCRYTAVRSG